MGARFSANDGEFAIAVWLMAGQSLFPNDLSGSTNASPRHLMEDEPWQRGDQNHPISENNHMWIHATNICWETYLDRTILSIDSEWLICFLVPSPLMGLFQQIWWSQILEKAPPLRSFTGELVACYCEKDIMPSHPILKRNSARYQNIRLEMNLSVPFSF